jgi:hypothetical protein
MVGTQEFFSPIAFDFLWEAMRIGELPYPLPVRSHGATEEERRMLRQRTHAELRARGIRDRHGRLEPHVEEWLSLLARPTISLDALHTPDFQRPPMAVLAATDGREGVVAIQDSAGILVRPAPLTDWCPPWSTCCPRGGAVRSSPSHCRSTRRCGPLRAGLLSLVARQWPSPAGKRASRSVGIGPTRRSGLRSAAGSLTLARLMRRFPASPGCAAVN